DVHGLESCEAEIRGPFLDGFEVPGAVQFEQWKDEWRARLMPRIRDCLVKQMDAGRRVGDFATVERHAQVLLDLDPLSEDAVRGFIEARAWVGDRSNALHAFARFEARLADELGAKPSAELVRIADLLREGRRAAPRPAGAGAGQVSERCERRFEAEPLSELTRVSPEIFAAFPGVPKPVEWAAEVIPLRLADAFLKAVEAATDESPLVLVVDDIHAADNASAAILHVIARKLPHTRLLLILTARSNELRAAAAPSALAADASIEVLRTLEVEPLPPAAAHGLVAGLVVKADGHIADVPVARILQAGNGNPLALELLTREWLAHGSGSLLGDLEA